MSHAVFIINSLLILEQATMIAFFYWLGELPMLLLWFTLPIVICELICMVFTKTLTISSRERALQVQEQSQATQPVPLDFGDASSSDSS
jgi:hypothetical protein